MRVALLAATVFTTLPAASGFAVEESPLSLEDLRPLGTFTVQLDGEEQPSFPSGTPCVYFEWSYGEKAGGEWSSFSTGYQSRADVVLLTKKGRVTVPMRKLRTSLRPSWSRTFTTKDAAEAPEPVRAEIAASKAPVTVEEYCLSKKTAYHARVHVEGYHLPPGSEGGKPRSRKNAVLFLSDAPFDGDKPGGPVTPAYRGWTY